MVTCGVRRRRSGPKTQAGRVLPYPGVHILSVGQKGEIHPPLFYSILFYSIPMFRTTYTSASRSAAGRNGSPDAHRNMARTSSSDRVPSWFPSTTTSEAVHWRSGSVGSVGG